MKAAEGTNGRSGLSIVEKHKRHGVHGLQASPNPLAGLARAYVQQQGALQKHVAPRAQRDEGRQDRSGQRWRWDGGAGERWAECALACDRVTEPLYCSEVHLSSVEG